MIALLTNLVNSGLKKLPPGRQDAAPTQGVGYAARRGRRALHGAAPPTKRGGANKVFFWLLFFFKRKVTEAKLRARSDLTKLAKPDNNI